MSSNNSSNKDFSLRDILTSTLKIGREILLGDFILMLIINLINALIPIMGIFINKELFSVIGEIAENKQYDQRLTYIIMVYLIYLLIVAVYTTFYQRFYIQFKSLLRFEKKIKVYLHKKCCKISNENFEMPELYNYVRQAQNASINIYRLIEIIIYIFSLIIGTIAITFYVSTFNILFISFILFSIIPTLVEKIYETKQRIYFRDKTTQLYREEEAYKEAIISPIVFKETRVLGAVKYIKAKWESSLDEIIENEKFINKKLLKAKAFVGMFKLIGNNFGFVLAAYLLIKKQINLGEFTASIVAYSSLNKNYTELFSMIGNFTQFSTLVKPFFRFLNIEDRKEDKEKKYSFTNEIKLENVTFSYPSYEQKVLDGINLTIKKGEKIAIVGINGAGKSTLVNIILGLYLPTKGNVYYDNQNIKEIEEEILYRDKTAVFQKFNKYNFTLEENIKISDMNKFSKDKNIEESIENLFENKKEIKGNTLLGKEFGGVELSGGEWQRVAIARGCFKDSDLIILDEPTSAIDPIREAGMYEDFKKILNNKTSIIITHRLGAIKLVDRILVIDNGNLIEEGSHEELLKKEGFYYKLWTSQAELYEFIEKSVKLNKG